MEIEQFNLIKKYYMSKRDSKIFIDPNGNEIKHYCDNYVNAENSLWREIIATRTHTYIHTFNDDTINLSLSLPKSYEIIE